MIPSYRHEIEQRSLDSSQSWYMGDSIQLCHVLGDYYLYVDCHDTTVAPWLITKGFWESWITAAMVQNIRHGDNCIDVGANCGYYSLLMAVCAGGEKLASVEPHPKLAGLIRRSLSLTIPPHMYEVHQKAASSVNGEEVTLTVPVGFWANSSIFERIQPEGEKVSVQTLTIDELTQSWPTVDFLKIDTEGAEEHVWDGMERTLDRNPQLRIILEFSPFRYEDPERFLNKIRTAGFHTNQIQVDAVVPASDDEILKEESNLLLTR